MTSITTQRQSLPVRIPDGVVDRRRYRRVLMFFAGLIANIIWWEVILRRIIGRAAVARSRSQRLSRYAREFRRLSVQIGGVMIKLGQFISARVDVMPPEITEELADLQDEVPPEPISEMLTVLQDQLGAQPETIFAEFDLNVHAAASLGQVYRARLHSGDAVVVKVQRPGIEHLVATDLAALRHVAQWAMAWRVIRKRADVPALLNEFARTLWQELDYESEANHAEKFKDKFSNDMRVYIPSVYRNFSTRRVITLEDVTSIKIADYAAIEAAGISRPVAARTLLDLYLRMVFEFNYFHADPHPGNLFLYPLSGMAIGNSVGRPELAGGQPFYVVFVDFGMVGIINDRVKQGLRELLIAVALRDSRRVLSAYQMLGILLPSADISRLEQAEQEILDTIWGRSVPELARMPRSEMHDFALKYRDLMYEMPFQVPQDFIYLGRALGILSGICTGLDPEFNPWEQIAEYAQRLVKQQSKGTAGTIVQEALKIGQTAISLPRQTENVLERIDRGELRARVSADDELRRGIRQLENAVHGITGALIFTGLLTSGTLLTIAGREVLGIFFIGLAAISWLMLVIRRSTGRD